MLDSLDSVCFLWPHVYIWHQHQMPACVWTYPRQPMTAGTLRDSATMGSVRVVLPARAGVFTFVTFQRGDGGVRLLLQLQQRDLARVIADEGVLRLVVVSERGSQGA